MDEQGTHFWLMVTQSPLPGGGFHTTSNTGTCTPDPGATRYDVYKAIKADVARNWPGTDLGNVTAFDIQPNQL